MTMSGQDRFDGGFGPQGAALILELQRLRQAFEQDSAEPHRHDAQHRRDQPLRRTASASRRSYSARRSMARLMETCCDRLGIDRRSDQTAATGDATAPGGNSGLQTSAGKLPPVELPQPETAAGVRILSQTFARMQQLARAPMAGVPVDLAGILRRVRVAACTGARFLTTPNRRLMSDREDRSLSAIAGHAYEAELRTGLRLLVLALIVGGGLLALVPLAGAVVVPGNLVVQSSVKALQHPSGGVVAEIRAGNGMHVRAGELLLRLDATQARTSLQLVNKQLDELRARMGRLIAERDGLDHPQPAASLMARAQDEDVRLLLDSEAALFAARLTARNSQKELLQGRMSQLGQEISGLEAQLGSKRKQLDLIAGELTGVQDLYDKRLVPLARLTALQREAARIDGESGQLTAALAETRSKIGEAQLQMVRLDQDFRTDVVKELGESRGKEAELIERSVAAKDQLDRVEMRAPVAGVIHQLSAHTVGGVIRAGETVAEIVPDADDLLIEARLQPKDVAEVRRGQTAYVRLSAFNQRTTPQLAGTVSLVSADTVRDPQTNTAYFTVQVILPEAERRRAGELQLVPGMPAEVFMQTGTRTMMNYLFRPITEQLQRAFIER